MPLPQHGGCGGASKPSPRQKKGIRSMNKRMTSIIVCLILLVTMMAFAGSASASTGLTISVKPDKTQASAGDSITYSVTISAVKNLTAVGFALDIPAGLQFVAGSGVVPEVLTDGVGFEKAEMKEETLYYCACAKTSVNLSTETLLLTFRCTVKEGFAGEQEVKLIVDPDEVFDENYDNIAFTVATTKVTVGSHTCAHDHYDITETTHRSVCSCGESIGEPVEHDGGTASCTEQAVCEICKNPYGEVNTNNHVGETQIRDAVKETCGEPGYSGNTYCKGCDTQIRKGEEIPATGDHVDADGKWEYNENGHYHTCSCGAEFNGAPHSGGEANCKSGAVCDICQQVYTDGNKENHVGETEPRNAAEATCGKPGYTGDTYCKTCDTMTRKGEEIPATGAHAGGTATCIDKAVCNICGQTYGDVDKNAHAGQNELRGYAEPTCAESGYTGDLYCLDCQGIMREGVEIPATGEHTGGTATCIDKAVCGICGQTYGDVDKNAHAGQNELRGYAEPTCAESGYTGDLYCLDCQGIMREGVEIPATGEHTGGEDTCIAGAVCNVCGQTYGDINENNHTGQTEIRNAAEATCGRPGYTGDLYCLDCQTMIRKGEEIPATGAHTGGQGTCTDKPVCDICDQEYGDVVPNNHNWNQNWSSDSKGHWIGCGDCDEGKDMEKHHDNDGDKKCDLCGYALRPIPDTGDVAMIGFAAVMMFTSACGAILVCKRRKHGC